jgi:hypothetical protein
MADITNWLVTFIDTANMTTVTVQILDEDEDFAYDRACRLIAYDETRFDITTIAPYSPETRIIGMLDDLTGDEVRNVFTRYSKEGEEARAAGNASVAFFRREFPVSETRAEEAAKLGNAWADAIDRAAPVSAVADTVIPEELCGTYSADSNGGCSYLRNHKGEHSWQ